MHSVVHRSQCTKQYNCSLTRQHINTNISQPAQNNVFFPLQIGSILTNSLKKATVLSFSRTSGGLKLMNVRKDHFKGSVAITSNPYMYGLYAIVLMLNLPNSTEKRYNFYQSKHSSVLIFPKHLERLC